MARSKSAQVPQFELLTADEHRLVGGTVLPPNGGPHNALLWLLSGKVQVLHGKRVFEHSPGKILYRRSHEKFGYRVAEGQSVQGVFVHFLAPDAWNKAQPRVKMHEGHSLAYTLMQALANTPKPQLARLGPALLAATLASLNQPPPVDDARWQTLPALVRKAMKQFKNDPAHDFSLASLAKTLGSSESTLCRQFKESLGLGPLEAQRSLRLEGAAQRLELGDDSIAEIAASQGFANPFHFSKLFSGAYELSPRAYRKRARQGETRRWQLIGAVSKGSWSET